MASSLLDLVESYRAADAATSTIYANEGRRVGRRGSDPTYQRGVLECARMYQEAMTGNSMAMLRFREALSTSDFPIFFGDILDRQLLAAYQSTPVQWQLFAHRGRVRDFRTVKRFTMDGGESVLDAVKELTEYPEATLAEGHYDYAVTKMGRKFAFSWESFINDDLGALQETPRRLATAARRSEEKFATALFAASTGPNATFFSTGNKNKITTKLSTAGLQEALIKMANQVDPDGNPIYVEVAHLVVPPALEITAKNIINATEILAATGGGDGTGNDQLRVANWMRNRVQLTVDPWLPIIDTTSGSTAWYLFADPSVGRPAMEVGFLTGHETPELWVKAPDAMKVGGGMVAPEEGDFDTDGIQYRVRHVFGGVLMDPKSGVASTGTTDPA
jgi:hypothetical protein